MSVHASQCSTVVSEERKYKLFIQINILVFPLELVNWLDAIKIRVQMLCIFQLETTCLTTEKQANPFV